MSKCVFIVDDNPLVRRLVRTCVEARLDHVDCHEAVNGLDAVQRAKDIGPDVIVLDLCMPMLNGLDAAAFMHHMLPKVPIILYTLHKEIVPEKQVQSFGIRAVVSKMDQIDVLMEQILKFVNVSKAASA